MPTNVYDNTFPPNTQLASLGAADLQQVRLDVQERMALISGTLAGRWNPGTDTQPLKWTGLLYFVTDTQQIFQWSGSAWVDVTSSFSRSNLLNAQGNAVGITGNGTDQVFYTYSLPGGTVANLQGIRVTVAWNHNLGSATIEYKLSLNGRNIIDASPTSQGNHTIRSTIINTGPTNGVYESLLTALVQPTSNNISNGFYNGLFNWANAQTLQITFNVANTDGITPYLWMVELIR